MFLLTCSYNYRNIYKWPILLLSLGDKYMAYKKTWLYVPNIDEKTLERLGQNRDIKRINDPYNRKNT